MSSVGWIDFSSEHRNKVRTVIDLLRKPGVVDELGIGVVRDSFADYLFPGVSTIQTRAKYFALTALLINDYICLPESKKEKQPFDDYLRDWEKQCRIKFVQRYGENAEGLGIIGVRFGERRDRDVQRPPSSVYWNGLRTFGIVRSPLSLAEFSRAIGGRRSLTALLQDTDHLKGDDLDAEADNGPRVRVPEIDEDYWQISAITLTKSEAEFLRLQIIATVPNSLLGQILLDEDATRQLLKLHRHASFADLAALPFIRHLRPELRKAVYHARDFWILLHGAHIRYNCLLQSRFGKAELRAKFEQQWEAWRDKIQGFNWSLWEGDYLWQLVQTHGSNVRPFTRRFVDGWIAQTHAGAHDLAACNKLVTDQERDNKIARARLRPGAKDLHIAQWIGLSDLEYRLTQVRTLVEDISRGESEEADPDAGR